MTTFAAQLPLFRAYDIRGARQYFTTEFIAALETEKDVDVN